MAHTLVELRVRDLGVIEDVTVELAPGMTALTGETGAGKTLLVEAIGLLLGAKADASVVRAGAAEAVVEGRLVARADLPTRAGPSARASTGRAPSRGQEGPEMEPGEEGEEEPGEEEDDDDEGGPGGEEEPEREDEELVLTRSVTAGGRSKAWIDGRIVPVRRLAEVAGTVIELHGQHQHRSLVRTQAQRDALDLSGDIDLTALEAARRALRDLGEESAALGGDTGQRTSEAELLRYQIEEIESAAIEGGEEGRLEIEEDRLAAAADHRRAAADALEAVSGSDDMAALDRLAQASSALAGRAPLAPVEARVRSVMADLSDIAAELRSVVETWEDDPRRLEDIRARRQLLRELGRKYGPTLDEVISFATTARGRRQAIEIEESRARELDGQIDATRAELTRAESMVAEARRRTAPRLAAQIQSTLADLAMDSARFEIAVDGGGPADDVTFLLGANPGEPLQSLARTASGGELARTMLAVRLALTDAPGVMVFDEVDAGVGGTAAVSVGRALAALGHHSQVLVVTHLAQVAAQADHQVEVRKSERSGRTRCEVAVLDHEARVVELSRMLSGRPDSLSARRHAEELLDVFAVTSPP